MSDKSTTGKTGAPPASRPNSEPAYDLFDSLQRARAKAKQLRPKPQSESSDRPQDSARRDEE